MTTPLADKVARLRGTFVAQVPARLAVVAELLRQLDGDLADDQPVGELKRLLHNLKGSSATFGLGELQAAAQAAEERLGLLLPGRAANLGAEMAAPLAVMARAVAPLLANAAAGSFRFSATQAEAVGPAKDKAGRGKRVYLCDDDPVLAEQLQQQIACFGYEVLVFESPAALREALPAGLPDALIMDAVFAEGVDAGFELVEELRRAGLSVPTLFISCRDDFEARLQAVQAGGLAYFAKPVRALDLVERLDELTSDVQPEPYRVLVVDDEPEVAAYHALLLEAAGMVVQAVTEPVRVLQVLRDFRADLVLMDLYMPNCSGRDLAQVIRQIPDFVSLPIVFLSTETDEGKQSSALRLGADDFLSKPIEPAQLVSTVRWRAERMRALHFVMGQLRLARDQAEGATRAKSAFLAMMSHEIRTPMNGVTTMAEMLEQTALATDQREMVGVIRSSAEILLAVINDILDFSKMEAGKLDIERVEFGLSDVVEDAADLLAGRAEEKGLELVVDIGWRVGDRLQGDPVRLRQILLNLAGNAVKFTERGTVVLRVRTLPSPDEGTIVLRFEVVDTGIGLSNEQRIRLFQPFEQADSSTTRRYGGTGLGLSISRELCALMGGAIGVDSVFGQGSTFWFELPFGVVAAMPAATKRIDDASVIPVGFQGAAREALGEALLADGIADPVWAGYQDDLAGLVAARCRAGTGQPVVVLLRAGGIGHEALAAAHRLMASPLAPPPVLMLVAAKGLAAKFGDSDRRGLSCILSQPLRRQALLAAIAAALGRGGAPGDAPRSDADASGWQPPPVEEARAAGGLILVAEDNLINQRVIGGLLSRRGYAFEIVGDGAEALAYWNRGSYGLLMTDIHMPEMGGVELTAAIRRLEQGRDIRLPIVALTGDALPDTERLCRDAGMDGYLTKPIVSKALTELLDRFLPQAKALRRRVEGRSQRQPVDSDHPPAARQGVDAG